VVASSTGGRTYDPCSLRVALLARHHLARCAARPVLRRRHLRVLEGKDWIRVPTIIYATMLFTNVVIILFEERPRVRGTQLCDGVWVQPGGSSSWS
jgi:hypothetical protein